jgi:hypothetical protein
MEVSKGGFPTRRARKQTSRRLRLKVKSGVRAAWHSSEGVELWAFSVIPDGSLSNATVPSAQRTPQPGSQ